MPDHPSPPMPQHVTGEGCPSSDLLGALEDAYLHTDKADDIVQWNDAADVQHLIAVARGCLRKSLELMSALPPNAELRRASRDTDNT